jgi:hypothetical protein
LRCSPNYQALIYSIVNSFLEWLYLQERIRVNPWIVSHVPAGSAAVDLDVVAVDTADVPVLLAAARSHTERLTVALPDYPAPAGGRSRPSAGVTTTASGARSASRRRARRRSSSRSRTSSRR